VENKAKARDKVSDLKHISSHSLGRSGEEAAVQYLKKHKYRVISRSFRFFRGEIDIVAFDRNTLVFFEVKTRKSSEFGFPEESVTPSKQRQIRKVAQGFLDRNKLHDVECRFDVLSLVLNDKGQFEITHIKDAFS